MPLHIHPVLRGLEEAEESEGLIVTLDSNGVKAILADEAAGRRIPKIVPVAHTRVLRGHAYTAS